MLRVWFAAAAVAPCMMPIVRAGQPPAVGTGDRAAVARAVPRTVDGRPDLQGVWTNGTLTPFERPAALADRAFLSEQEAAEMERQAAGRRANASANRKPGDIGGDNEAFVDSGYRVAATRQTSLVVQPKNGRVPFLPEAERRREFNLTSMDSYDSMSPWDRCITRGPTGMFPAGYNNGYQIFQTATHVAILQEMIHEVRIIPLDGSAHVGAQARFWAGDSRGRWEAATLVVETTNFHDRGWISTHAGSGRLRGTPHGEGLRVVERFTRVDADTLTYEMTIDDPSAYAEPWAVSIPMTRHDDYRLYEYACHEGNLAVSLMLGGARAQESAAAAARP
jgi:hypothetical protein